MTVYTQCLWRGQVSNAYTVVYTVPAGVAVVLRDIELSNLTGAADDFIEIDILGSGGAGSAAVMRLDVKVGTSVQWQGRVAMESGARIQTAASTSGIAGQFTGYVFNSP